MYYELEELLKKKFIDCNNATPHLEIQNEIIKAFQYEKSFQEKDSHEYEEEIKKWKRDSSYLWHLDEASIASRKKLKEAAYVHKLIGISEFKIEEVLPFVYIIGKKYIRDHSTPLFKGLFKKESLNDNDWLNIHLHNHMMFKNGKHLDKLSEINEENIVNKFLSSKCKQKKYIVHYSKMHCEDMTLHSIKLFYLTILSNDVKKKIILPGFYQNKEDKYYLYLPKTESKLPLFSKGYTSIYQADYIIITDSIELADLNSHIHQGILWISWYGMSEYIDYYDWSVLKDKTVYYLLYSHKEISKDDIMETANKLQDKLRKEIEVENFIFIYDVKKYTPLLDIKEFHILNGVYYTKVLAIWKDWEKSYHNSSEIGRKPYLLNKPCFYEGDLTLLSGIDDCTTSLFAKHLAHSLSQNMALLKGWENMQQPINVLYFYPSATESNRIPLKDWENMASYKNTLFQIPLDIRKMSAGLEVDINIFFNRLSSTIESHISNYPSLGSHIFIIFDHSFPIFYDKAIYKNVVEIYMASTIRFFNLLNYRGISIILIPSISGVYFHKSFIPNYKRHLSMLQFDNIIKITPKASNTGQRMKVEIKFSNHDIKGTSRSFLCELKHTKAGSELKKIRGRTKSKHKWLQESKLDLVKKVVQLLTCNSTTKEIAKKLNISESWIKRIRAEVKFQIKKRVFSQNDTYINDKQTRLQLKSKKVSIMEAKEEDIVSTVKILWKNKDNYKNLNEE